MKFNRKIQDSENELTNRGEFYNLYKNNPLPKDEILSNLGLFINRKDLSRILFMNEMYQKIINTHGVVMEFGVRWGQNLALFESFRGMYEPFNTTRKIIGFDTFEGFQSVHEKDGISNQEKDYSVTENYEEFLEQVMDYHESESPINHLKKYELVKGNAVETLQLYLEQNPATIIAFAYFDFDIYEPTKKCLELIKNHLTKGSIIGFDQLNDSLFPGETLAFKEVLGTNNFTIHRAVNSSCMSYIVFE